MILSFKKTPTMFSYTLVSGKIYLNGGNIMAKKYRYNTFYPYTFGTIDLTKKEAAVVAYAMIQDNWRITLDEPYSGDCWIDADHPQEIED